MGAIVLSRRPRRPPRRGLVPEHGEKANAVILLAPI
jgi:hypothetical protein